MVCRRGDRSSVSRRARCSRRPRATRPEREAWSSYRAAAERTIFSSRCSRRHRARGMEARSRRALRGLRDDIRRSHMHFRLLIIVAALGARSLLGQTPDTTRYTILMAKGPSGVVNAWTESDGTRGFYMEYN